MAIEKNKFERYEWTDRQVQYPARRLITPTNEADVYDVERYEGVITEMGDTYNAASMNSLEKRIASAFENLEDTDIAVTNEKGYFVAGRLDGVLDELFTHANSGKKMIADAISATIGVTVSAASTFQNIATSVSNGLTLIRSNIASAIGQTRNGTTAASLSFAELGSVLTNHKTTYYKYNIYLNQDINLSPGTTTSTRLNVSFGFTPSYVILCPQYFYTVYGGRALWETLSPITNLTNSNKNASNRYTMTISGIDTNGFTLNANIGSAVSEAKLLKSLDIYAVGRMS